MKIVRALVPDLTIAVCKAALAHCKMDGMQAAHLLQDFKRANAAELQALHKVRHKTTYTTAMLACVCTRPPTQTYAPATVPVDASDSDAASSEDSDRCDAFHEVC